MQFLQNFAFNSTNGDKPKNNSIKDSLDYSAAKPNQQTNKIEQIYKIFKLIQNDINDLQFHSNFPILMEGMDR